MDVDHSNSPQVKSFCQQRLELSRQILLARHILPFLPVWDVCPLSYLWQWVRKRSRHGAGTGGLCESAPGPRPLLYAGTRSEGLRTQKQSRWAHSPHRIEIPPSSKRERIREGERVGADREPEEYSLTGEIHRNQIYRYLAWDGFAIIWLGHVLAFYYRELNHKPNLESLSSWHP